jgi:hypothetical protein
MVDPQAILSALGVQTLPPGVAPQDVIAKVLGDHLVRERCFTRLVERECPDVLRECFHPIELAALRKKSGAEVVRPKFTIQWALDEDFQTGVKRIVAKAFLEGKRDPDETMWFQPLTIDEARKIRFKGESVPGDLLYVYGLYLGGGPSAELISASDARARALQEAQKAQEKQNRLPAWQPPR